MVNRRIDGDVNAYGIRYNKVRYLYDYGNRYNYRYRKDGK